ncbi:MAG: TauD/TfdA family dioxygenase [Gammaproteobacteria bacterium]|nr:TauD/TfdA family dioxygenase [Gammaproteobacteria bacterium]
MHPSSSPFALNQTAATQDAYDRWRDQRLARAAVTVAELIVEVANPLQLTAAEQQAIAARIADNNMAIYACREGAAAARHGKAVPRRMAEQFGLHRIDSNFLADDDGITSITVKPKGTHATYIPYTNHPINWHTDGYYNPEGREILGMVVHCEQPAQTGGESGLMDYEMLYLLLRERSEAHIVALMQPDVLTIPAGTDSDGGVRPETVGPVYWVDAKSGQLAMRYTARQRNAVWRDDSQTLAAQRALEAIFASKTPYIYHAKLEAGMGLICNNVLHKRNGFSDAPADAAALPRLFYRARYFDRVSTPRISSAPRSAVTIATSISK